MTTHDHTTHDELPQELRGLAVQLEALGELERLAAEEAVARTTMRTKHLLTERGAPTLSVPERLRGLWLWFAAPAVAVAGVLLGVVVMRTPAPSPRPADRPQALADGIESDIDAWMELDSMWSSDSFETNLAAISIDAAGISAGADNSLDSLSVFESGL